jgi:RNA polymerase sigma factor (TIGR02999 family)
MSQRPPEEMNTGDLIPLVYEELRALARRYLRAERTCDTLQPTALVHEAYIRLVGIDRMSWTGRPHFLAMAARQMRRILIEHARAAGAQKRGGRPQQVTLQDADALTEQRSLELIALDQALDKLERRSPRQASVAEARLFAGMTAAETAGVLKVSERTVKEDWRAARAWLSRELGG